MNTRHLVLAAVLAGGTLSLFAFAPWQDAKAKEKSGGAPFTPAEMQALQKAATPGPQHAEIQKLAGSWTVQAKSWMKPGLPAEEWSGTAECKPMLGGRYLAEDFSGTMSMGPYHGHGMLGFNNTTKQWEHVWMDDMGTGMMVSQGETKDGATVLHSTFTCPLNGEQVSTRTVLTSLGDDERTVDMWTTMSGQPEFQSMSLHYKRTGAAPKAEKR